MRFRCQPELSLSISYWSITFALICWGSIFFRENKDTIAWVMTGLFVCLALIGSRRCFLLDDDSINYCAILPKNRYSIKIKEINMVLVGKRGLTLMYRNESPQKTIVLMFESTKGLFVKELEANKYFTGKVMH